jgi:hypothetical protein
MPLKHLGLARTLTRSPRRSLGVRLSPALLSLALATPAAARDSEITDISLIDVLFGLIHEAVPGGAVLEVDPRLLAHPAKAADPPDPDRVALAALELPGLAPAFHPRQSRYAVPPSADGRFPVSVTVGDPSIEVFLDGARLVPGRVAYAQGRPGEVFEVVAYHDRAELGRYTITVDPGLVLPGLPDAEPSLYISGGEGLRRIRLDDDAQTTLAAPVEGKSFLLATAGDRLYASLTGVEYAIAAFDLTTHQATDHAVLGETWQAGALAVAPGGDRLHVFHQTSPVMGTYDAHDLQAPAQPTYLPGVGMPMQATYRPGLLDLYVSDYWADPEGKDLDATHIAVRRPFVDWQAGVLDFAWAGRALPPSQTNSDGTRAAGVAFLTEQGLVVAVNSLGDEVVVLDEATGETLARTATGAMPFFIAADPDSDVDQGRVFVAGLQSGTLAVYTITQSASGGVVIEQEARFNPCKDGSAVKPVFGTDPGTAYLLCTDGVTVLDADSLEVERHIPVGGAWQKDMVWATR